MTRKELHEYWRYYLLLERRFIETIIYTELHEMNFSAFSNNYALLMQSVGAEMDTVFKLYCGFKTDERKNIADYVNYIDIEERMCKQLHSKEYPFRSQEIRVIGTDIIIQPFKDWDSSKPAQSLAWWDAFDRLKHNRYENRHLANQENTLNMFGAVFLLEMKMLKKITEGTEEWDVFDKGSELFTLKSWSTKVVPIRDAFAVMAEMINNNGECKPKASDV